MGNHQNTTFSEQKGINRRESLNNTLAYWCWNRRDVVIRSRNRSGSNLRPSTQSIRLPSITNGHWNQPPLHDVRNPSFNHRSFIGFGIRGNGMSWNQTSFSSSRYHLWSSLRLILEQELESPRFQNSVLCKSLLPFFSL